ncbi:hypothetical protein H2199_006343 [Coniosporium tulheliwenetii]|uniref:Uncharacterized protein n=1 Tax=Coniosporium tulheliwenetii TaxID=3383036 RepID=A0ACC2YXE5_9PEZI|nr:hypothetical protein H2199_006343 [Cladosporium sp. JES 115]
MTRKEYFDYHYQVHGSKSDAPSDNEIKPHKYIQTQIFDSAFGPRRDGPPNANHHWCGRDDVTELWFRDLDHLQSVFKSDYVKQTVGPDGRFFADFETTMVLLAEEKPLSLSTKLAEQRGTSSDSSDGAIALFFISTPENERTGSKLEKELSPPLVKVLEDHATNDVYNLLVNVGLLSDEFDLSAYFGGSSMPQYALVYKMCMKQNSSVAAVRDAQKAFEKLAADRVDTSESFIVFGKEALVLDVENGIKVRHAVETVYDYWDY